ncbi:Uncharacterized protein FKW44_018776 [Caligus rogercresseyi]|uniref:Uncharacterized protein n=1 Tax=Caligus rogercresseyi TaxID=217165 RepID=A0A7T8GUW6_CALRO|nr:Uncharacterized protein FKW44_018776 [Caligus rogercresseyi]
MEPRGTKLKLCNSGVRRTSNFLVCQLLAIILTRCGAFGLGIWCIVENKACANHHPSVNALKASVEKEWAAMSEEHIRKVCRAFRPRLEAMGLPMVII